MAFTSISLPELITNAVTAAQERYDAKQSP